MSSRIPNGFLRLSVPVLSKIAPRLAVIGSGPGAFYTAKYIMRQLDSARIDMFERLPEPFGLVNYGVAPDHPEVKNVRNEFRAVAHEYHDRFRLFAEAEPKLSSLQQHYDGIVVATGAQDAHRLGLPGSEQVRRGILSARDFVSWYNGHPDFAAVTSMLPPAEETEKVVVIGHGNVALDVARVLSKPVGEFESTEISREALQWLSKRPPNSGKVSVVGRRGFPEAKFTNKELREITRIDGVTARAYESELIGKQDWHLDRAKKRGLHLIEAMTSRDLPSEGRQILLRFHSVPKRVITSEQGGALKGIEVEHPDSSTEIIPCGLLIEAVRFKVIPPLAEGAADYVTKHLRIDSDTGGMAHDGSGRVRAGLYLAGWAKRGPTGIIAANISCSQSTANAVVEDILQWKMLHKEGEVVDESDAWMVNELPSARECRF